MAALSIGISSSSFLAAFAFGAVSGFLASFLVASLAAGFLSSFLAAVSGFLASFFGSSFFAGAGVASFSAGLSSAGVSVSFYISSASYLTRSSVNFC